MLGYEEDEIPEALDEWRRLCHPDDVEPTLARGGASVGIAGMRERVALVGGTLELRSRPGAGCEIVVAIPLAPRGSGDAPAAEGAR
jgi:signal transduction histidine kinase